MSKPLNPLRLNVGFITQQPVGYSREFLFDFPALNLGPDLPLNHFMGSARISRTPQGLVMQVTLQAESPVECVRCLAPCQQKLSTEFTELYAFSSRSTSESGLLFPENGQIDLAPLAREYLLLDMPIGPLCRVDCQGLCPVCGENRNEAACEHEPEGVDPRMAALQTLLDE